MNENDKEITENMQEIAFSQLLEQIRKQDDLIHSWPCGCFGVCS